MSSSELTIGAAVRRYDVRATTISELLEAGRIEGARRRASDDGGAQDEWVFPEASLAALGFARRGQQVGVYPVESHARRWRWWVAGGALAVLLVLPLLSFAADRDDADSGLAAAVAARTTPGEPVGVVGGGTDAVTEAGRVPVVIDETTPTDEVPAWVVVSEDAASAAAIARFVGRPGRVRTLNTAEGRFWLVAGSDAEAPLGSDPGDPTEPSITGPEVGPSTTGGGPAATTAPDPTTTTTTAATTTTTSTTAAPVTAPPASAAPPSSPPATAGPGPSSGLDPAPDEGPTVDARRSPGRSIIVADGEHFWALADAVVTAADPDAGTSAVTAYWAALVDANRDILVDPGNADLLLVGQAVQLPPLTT